MDADGLVWMMVSDDVCVCVLLGDPTLTSHAMAVISATSSVPMSIRRARF